MWVGFCHEYIKDKQKGLVECMKNSYSIDTINVFKNLKKSLEEI
jgi:hypothetical protein